MKNPQVQWRGVCDNCKCEITVESPACGGNPEPISYIICSNCDFFEVELKVIWAIVNGKKRVYLNKP